MKAGDTIGAGTDGYDAGYLAGKAEGTLTIWTLTQEVSNLASKLDAAKEVVDDRKALLANLRKVQQDLTRDVYVSYERGHKEGYEKGVRAGYLATTKLSDSGSPQRQGHGGGNRG